MFMENISVMDAYSLLVTIIATLFAIFSLLLTYVGYHKFKHADKLVQEKVKQEIDKFRNNLDETLIDIQNANQKVAASYKYFETKEPQKAIHLLLEAEKIYPKAFNLYNTLGYAYQLNDDLVNAELYFKKAILTHPKRIEGYNDLSEFYKSIGDNKKAQKIKSDAERNVKNAKDNWQVLS